MFFWALNSNAQNKDALIAEKLSHRKLFTLDEKVKVKFNYQGISKRIAGRIHAVSVDSLYIRGLRKNSQLKITAIPIASIEKIKNFYAGARTFGGLLAMGGVTGGFLMMLDAVTNDAIFFPQGTVTIAAASIGVSLLPYSLITLAEPSFSLKRNYKFRGMADFKK